MRGGLGRKGKVSMKIPKIATSGFGLIDVTTGRHSLFRYFGKKFIEPTGAPIPIIIHAEITSPWGGDDGESREFEISIKKLEVKA